MKSIPILLFLLVMSNLAQSQTYRPDLYNPGLWEVTNRKVETFNEQEKKAIRFNALSDDGVMLLKDYMFSNGTIEFDVKGKNVVQQSFVGVAFHAQDAKRTEIIYFRPFNFMNADTIRRPRSVQYVSMPEYPWEKLREQHPGKYENKVNPVPNPDGWFHVKMTIEGKEIKVYVNRSSSPSLEVQSLSNATSGRIGLWAGNNSDGSFANLEITPLKRTGSLRE